jgi:hypothetical protein
VQVNSQTPHPQRVFYALASLPRRRIIACLSQTALSTAELQGQRVLYRLKRDALLGALARFASEVDGPLRHAPQAGRNPRDAI